MDDLYRVVDNVDKDNTFEVLQILKESPHEITEKVRALNGKEYIRKYFLDDGSFSKEKLEAISKLTHPNLPHTHDYYELADRSVIIQDFIDGKLLSDLIEEKGHLEYEEVVDFTISLCDAAQHMHDQEPNPLIHRDIKPGNIIIDNEGCLKLIDFGTVREFKEDSNKDTVHLGTFGYASPEQFGFGQTDVRSDIYSMGMTMKHMITGKAPERGRDDSKSEVSGKLESIIAKATKFDPEERYQNALVLREALRGHYNKVEMPSVQRKRPAQKGMQILGYILMGLFFISIIYNSIVNPTGFGQKDDLLELGEYITVVIMLSLYLVMGFNLFDINQKWKFFAENRRLKKAILSVAIFIITAILLMVLQSFHSEAYNLANSAVS